MKAFREKPFRFKQFEVYQEKSLLKVNTDGCLLAAVVAHDISLSKAKTVKPNTILDIGTGTGVIALMLAQAFTAEIDAVEIDNSSAKQAKYNFEISPWANRLHCYHDDIIHFHGSSVEEYQLIVSNPPFFDKAKKSPYKHKNLSKHNEKLPQDALVNAIAKLLAKEGICYIILPIIESEKFTLRLSKAQLYLNRKILVKPISYKPPHRVILKISKAQTTLTNEIITIRNKYEDFDETYISLLSAYYLAF